MGHRKGRLRGKFIAMSACIKRSERFQINDLMLHLNLLQEQEQTNTKTSKWREIIKIRAKITEIETKKKPKHTKKSMKQRAGSLKK
jgi:hypothetical protein